jgi:hypothetical protein
MTENNAAQPGLNDTIRAVFLEHGFTIKEGQTDLKPYVYEAVHALLSKLRAEGVQAGDERRSEHIETLQQMRADYNPSDGPMSELKAAALDAAISALASAPVAATTDRQYHYRMQNCTPGRAECRDGNGYPECPCWHDVGTGPLKGKEATATHWRDKPSSPVAGEAQKPVACGERVYAFRRKGLDDFVTCSQERFEELQAKPRLFETRIFYASPVDTGNVQPVAWMVDWPDEPDLGHALLEDPVPGARNRALVLRHAAPQASEAVRDALAELVRLQDAKDSQNHFPNPQRSKEWAEYRRLWPTAMEKARAALKTQADKDGGDCAKGAAKRFHGLVEEAIIWLETGGGRADSLCADLRKALAAQKQGDSE